MELPRARWMGFEVRQRPCKPRGSDYESFRRQIRDHWGYAHAGGTKCATRMNVGCYYFCYCCSQSTATKTKQTKNFKQVPNSSGVRSAMHNILKTWYLVLYLGRAGLVYISLGECPPPPLQAERESSSVHIRDSTHLGEKHSTFRRGDLHPTSWWLNELFSNTSMRRNEHDDSRNRKNTTTNCYYY